MKMYLSLMGIGIGLVLITATPLLAAWTDAGSYLYTTENVTIGANSSSRQLYIKGDNSVVRLDRSVNSPGFMIVRTQAGIGPLKTFLCGVTAWGQDEGRFVIEDLHQETSGSGDVRLAIDEDGYVGIGTTIPDYKLDVAEGDIGLDNTYGVKFENAAGEYKGSIGMTTNDMYITNFGGQIHLQTVPTVLGVAMSIQSTGASGRGNVAIWTLGNGAVYSNNSVLTNTNPSSRDYKKDIKPIDLKAKRVLNLEPKSFTWKNNGEADFGYIAEEVATVIPEIYRNDGNAKGYASGKLGFYIIEVLKDQENRIDQLQTEIRTLKARLDKE